MKYAGFSLIELLATMAISAIVAAVAYPSYQHHMQTSYRQQAKVSLHAAAHQLELYYHQHHSYNGASVSQHTDFYQLKLQTTQDQHYTITATPTGPQVHDHCGKLSLNDNGQYRSSCTKPT